jgi:CysZ protein
MKYLVLLLLSPMFAYLSQKTDEILTTKKYPFNLLQFLSDIKRGIIITLRNAFLESIIIFLGIILSVFFPLLSPIVLLLLFLLNSYFMAFNFFDYIAERKRLGVNRSIRYMRSNFSTLLGFGVAYNLVSFVPFLDWVLAPISAASGAVIADFEKSGLINSKNNV